MLHYLVIDESDRNQMTAYIISRGKNTGEIET
jgi:hypothetical protein